MFVSRKLLVWLMISTVRVFNVLFSVVEAVSAASVTTNHESRCFHPTTYFYKIQLLLAHPSWCSNIPQSASVAMETCPSDNAPCSAWLFCCGVRPYCEGWCVRFQYLHLKLKERCLLVFCRAWRIFRVIFFYCIRIIHLDLNSAFYDSLHCLEFIVFTFMHLTDYCC